MPIYSAQQFRLTIDDQNYMVDFSYKQGKLLSPKLASPLPVTSFHHHSFSEQVITVHEGKLHYAHSTWEGELFETYQKNVLEYCGFFDHPFLKAYRSRI